MKKMLLPLLIVTLFVVQAISAADVLTPYNPRTGDARFDANLREVNNQALRDKDAFAARMNTTYSASRSEIDLMMQTHKMSPGDVYMAYRLSRVTGKPVEKVVGAFKDNPGRGWGVIAKRLGIKPGSREFHELKKGDRAFGFPPRIVKNKGRGLDDGKRGKDGHQGKPEEGNRDKFQHGQEMNPSGHGAPGGGHGRGR